VPLSRESNYPPNQTQRARASANDRGRGSLLRSNHARTMARYRSPAQPALLYCAHCMLRPITRLSTAYPSHHSYPFAPGEALRTIPLIASFPHPTPQKPICLIPGLPNAHDAETDPSRRKRSSLIVPSDPRTPRIGLPALLLILPIRKYRVSAAVFTSFSPDIGVRGLVPDAPTRLSPWSQLPARQVNTSRQGGAEAK
jgi:hypothetical protein